MRQVSRFIKPLIFLVSLVVILFVTHRYGLSDKFMEALPSLRELVNQSPVYAALLYILATSSGCVLLALPGAAFALIAGLLFEPLTGTLLCLIAATLGAVLAFIAGRYFLRDSVKPMIEKSALLKNFLFDNIEHNGVILLMITRLVPLFPFNLQNFAYGLTDIRLTTYTLCTFIFMAPGAAAFTLGAAGLTSSERRELYLFLAVTLAVIVTLIGMLLRKKFVIRK